MLVEERHEDIVAFLVLIGGCKDAGWLPESFFEIFVVVFNKETEECYTPVLEFNLEFHILLVNMVLRINVRTARILERAFVGNHTDTTPRAVVHRRDGWKVVTREEHLAHHIELLLI